MAGVEHDFDEFADTIERIESRVERDVVDAALKDTAEELVDVITQILDGSTTRKGGTYDSRTSPYEPGTSNDSSNDPYHISDRTAWNVKLDNANRSIIVTPKPEVKDRAFWIEKGTPDHGPSGDTPMHFYVNGFHVVMADKPSRDDPNYESYIQASAINDENDARFTFGEPTEVEGLDPLNYFENAVRVLAGRRTFSKNLNKHWERVLEEEGFEL